MSSLKRVLFLSVCGAAMSGTVALAADLPAPPVIDYEPETVVEIGSNWYLRGDLGYAAYNNPEGSWLSDTNYNHVFYDEELKNGWLVGAGVGYYFNENFRADLTVDYRHQVKFKAKNTCVTPCAPATYTTETNHFSAWTLLLNGYYDFGTWHSITPYVGGGIGLAHISTGTHKSSDGDRRSSGDTTNFAWNLMAGAAFQVADNVRLDANYRYLNLGEAESGKRTNTTVVRNPVKYEDLSAHEFRIGLRYDLD